MKKTLTVLFATLLSFSAESQCRIIYESNDSVRIEQILSDAACCSTTGERIMSIANKFIGEKYIGSTLEQGAEEPLFISCTELDCTTFVELVLAIAKTSYEDCSNFNGVCHNLEKIRYRNGKNNGYTSRLHYISWWIEDSAKAEIIEDVTPRIGKEKQPLNLNFMSTHPSSYPLLAANPEFVKEIARLETPYRGIEVSYIPKEEIKHNGHEDIKPGDIIAITTSIPGLDVTHIGFAHYINGKLCLLHASSAKGEVIKDTSPLCDYLKNHKRHTGIRVFRARF